MSLEAAKILARYYSAAVELAHAKAGLMRAKRWVSNSAAGLQIDKVIVEIEVLETTFRHIADSEPKQE